MSTVAELREQVIGWMEFPQTGGADDLDALIAAVRAENEDRVQAAVSRAEHAERRADDLQSQLFAQNERHKRRLSAVRAETLAEVKGTAPQSPWRPTTETPEEGRWVVVAFGFKHFTPHFWGGFSTFQGQGAKAWRYIDDWNEPLPAPPTEEAG